MCSGATVGRHIVIAPKAKTQINSPLRFGIEVFVPQWMIELRKVLSNFYPAEGPPDLLGYLKGSGNPDDWRIKAMQKKPQFMILGNVQPTAQDWVDAGKPGTDPIQTIYPGDLNGLIILYGGGRPRPWGRIEIVDNEALQHYQSATIDNFRRNLSR
jgi:hypothetical protein